MSLVFDASALIALLNDEPGAEFVQELFDDSDVPKYVHAVNLVETFYHIARKSDCVQARVHIQSLRDLGLEERHDLDVPFWEDVAALKADHNIALGDCFGVALARRLNGDFVSADRHELTAVAAIDACRIAFIR